MRGKIAKKLKKMARKKNLNYRKLKKKYKEWRKDEGWKEDFDVKKR